MPRAYQSSIMREYTLYNTSQTTVLSSMPYKRSSLSKGAPYLFQTSWWVNSCATKGAQTYMCTESGGRILINSQQLTLLELITAQWMDLRLGHWSWKGGLSLLQILRLSWMIPIRLMQKGSDTYFSPFFNSLSGKTALVIMSSFIDIPIVIVDLKLL